MLVSCNKPLIGALVAIVLLTGCGGAKKSVRSAPPATDKQQEVQQQQAEVVAKINPRAKQDFDDALKAMEAGDDAKAEALLRKVSAEHPDLSGPYVNLGLLKFRSGKLDDAEKQFQQALKVNPRSAVSFNHLGIILRGKGQFKEAREYYEKALDINPDYAFAHLNYGILLDLYIGELEKALEHYGKFQELSQAEDKEVTKWIADLNNRIKKQNK